MLMNQARAISAFGLVLKPNSRSSSANCSCNKPAGKALMKYIDACGLQPVLDSLSTANSPLDQASAAPAAASGRACLAATSLRWKLAGGSVSPASAADRSVGGFFALGTDRSIDVPNARPNNAFQGSRNSGAALAVAAP